MFPTADSCRRTARPWRWCTAKTSQRHFADHGHASAESGGVSGQGSVVTLTFVAKASGHALTITRGGARDPAMQAIPVNGAQAAVTIQ